MKKRIISVVAILLAVVCCMAQSRESDRLFAIGVEKYNAGDYNGAIGCFERVDSIDTAELDSISPRRVYGKLWLASCWFKLGDIERAKAFDEVNYYLEPIDRRLTVESDSLQLLAVQTFQSGDLNGAINLLLTELQKETSVFGEEHYWPAGTLKILAMLYGNSGDADKAIEYMNRCVALAEKWFNGDTDFSQDYLFMSNVLLSANRYAETGDWLARAEESILNHHGYDSELYDNLFSMKLYLYVVCNQWDEAEKHIKEFRKVMERRFGKNSIEEKNLLLNIANLYDQAGRSREAGNYRNEAVRLKNDSANKDATKLTHFMAEVNFVNDLIDSGENKKAIKKLDKLIAETKNSSDSISRVFYWTVKSLKASITNSMVKRRNSEPLTYADYQQAKEELGNMSYMVGFFYVLNDVLFKDENYSPEENERVLTVLREITPALLYYTQNDPILCAGSLSQLALIYAMSGQVTYSRKYSAEATVKYMELINNSGVSHSYDRLSKELKKQITTIKYHIDKEDDRYFASKQADINLHHDSISYAGHKLRSNMLECKLLLDLKTKDGIYDITSDFSDYYVDMGVYCNDSIHARAFMLDYKQKITDRFGKGDEIYDAMYLDYLYPRVGYYCAKMFPKGSYEGKAFYEELLAAQKDAGGFWYNRTLEDYYEFINDKDALVRLRVDNLTGSPADILLSKFSIYKNAEMRDEAIASIEEFFSLLPDDELSLFWLREMVKYLLMENPESAYKAISELFDNAEQSGRKDYMSVVMCNLLIGGISDECSDDVKNNYRQFLGQQIGSRQAFNSDPSLRLHLDMYQTLLYNTYKDAERISDILSGLNVKHISQQIKNQEDEAEIVYTNAMWNSYRFYGKDAADQIRTAIDYFESNEDLKNTAEYKTLLIALSNSLSETDDSDELLKVYEEIVTANPLKQLSTAFIEKYGLEQNISAYSIMGPLNREYLDEADFGKYSRVLEASGRIDDLKPMLVKTLGGRLNEINIDLKRSYIDWNVTARRAAELCGTIARYAEAYSDVDSLAILAYDASMLCKGMLLRAEGGLFSVLAASDNASISDKFKTMQELKARLEEAHREGVETGEIQRQYDRVRREMVDQANRLGNFTSNLQYTSKDVARKLSEGDVAIEFMSSADESQTITYYAAVLRAGMTPRLIRLCTDGELHAVSSPYTTDEIYRLVWRPIETLLQGESDSRPMNIYFAPTGAMHQLAIEYVPDSEGQPVSQRHNLFRLSNTAELLNDGGKDKRPGATMLYGGIIYDDGSTPSVSGNAKRGAVTGIGYLPGTREEVMSISRELDGSDYDVTVVTGSDATEMSVKNLSGSGVSVLHLATHGFYNPDGGGASDSGADDPLTHSGLYMAGASGAVAGFRTGNADDDGILTAKDIADLDFSDAGLVVLSACQTALGRVSDEGVFGLQRGFKKAGAGSLLMSLWPVDDEATQILMTRFYRNLANRLSKREALHESQNYLRTVDDGYYDDPDYWAAFILLDAVE